MLKAYRFAGDLEGAERTLAAMQEAGSPFSVITIQTLADMHARAGNPTRYVLVPANLRPSPSLRRLLPFSFFKYCNISTSVRFRRTLVHEIITAVFVCLVNAMDIPVPGMIVSTAEASRTAKWKRCVERSLMANSADVGSIQDECSCFPYLFFSLIPSNVFFMRFVRAVPRPGWDSGVSK